MKFVKLTKLCVAILAREAYLDYLNKTFKIVIEPSYGYDESVRNKKFKLEFKDCIYLTADNIPPKLSNIEFIAWGERPVNCCRGKECKLFLNLVEKQVNPLVNIKKRDQVKYTHFFFQNIVGNCIELLAAKASVTELK